MNQVSAPIGKRVKGEEGATAVEYGIMVMLVALVIIGSVVALGGQVNALLSSALPAFGGG